VVHHAGFIEDHLEAPHEAVGRHGHGEREALVEVLHVLADGEAARAQFERLQACAGDMNTGADDWSPVPGVGVCVPQLAQSTMARFASSVGAGVPAGGMVPAMSRVTMRSTGRAPFTGRTIAS
jgi:hypothetical protein